MIPRTHNRTRCRSANTPAGLRPSPLALLRSVLCADSDRCPTPRRRDRSRLEPAYRRCASPSAARVKRLQCRLGRIPVRRRHEHELARVGRHDRCGCVPCGRARRRSDRYQQGPSQRQASQAGTAATEVLLRHSVSIILFASWIEHAVDALVVGDELVEAALCCSRTAARRSCRADGAVRTDTAAARCARARRAPIRAATWSACARSGLALCRVTEITLPRRSLNCRLISAHSAGCVPCSENTSSTSFAARGGDAGAHQHRHRSDARSARRAATGASRTRAPECRPRRGR